MIRLLNTIVAGVFLTLFISTSAGYEPFTKVENPLGHDFV
jgi:hypothetical protein